ncbi:MAG: hypothetical protein MRY21_02125 [Simkaniaceae bacterium]|nr:hypothetical protein [Simkaniaceae bacterium]
MAEYLGLSLGSVVDVALVIFYCERCGKKKANYNRDYIKGVTHVACAQHWRVDTVRDRALYFSSQKSCRVILEGDIKLVQTGTAHCPCLKK